MKKQTIKLTMMEKIALRYGVYSGIPMAKIKAAKINALRKITRRAI